MVAEEPGILRSDEEKNLCERAGRVFLFLAGVRSPFFPLKFVSQNFCAYVRADLRLDRTV